MRTGISAVLTLALKVTATAKPATQAITHVAHEEGREKGKEPRGKREKAIFFWWFCFFVRTLFLLLLSRSLTPLTFFLARAPLSDSQHPPFLSTGSLTHARHG